MSINLVIAVTDGDWFDLLRGQPNLAEVNFWAPSAANFRALQPGELFLFKLHAPRNVIVGGGVFACSRSGHQKSSGSHRHDHLGNTGRKTGFWLEELAAPYYVFEDAGAP